MKKLILTATAVLALAACDKGGDADGDGEVTQEEMAAEMRSEGAIDMQPGQWEVTTSFTEFDAPGMPEQAREMAKQTMTKGTTITTCLTEEQVADPGTEFLGGTDDSCKFQKFDRSGAKMSAAMTCSSNGMEMASNMDGEFGKTAYSMNIDTTVKGSPMGDMVMKGSVKGKRIGDCPS